MTSNHFLFLDLSFENSRLFFSTKSLNGGVSKFRRRFIVARVNFKTSLMRLSTVIGCVDAMRFRPAFLSLRLALEACLLPFGVWRFILSVLSLTQL